MSIKLKVLDIDKTPEDCTKRVILERDETYQEWVRDMWDHTFLLWSNSSHHRGDRIFDRNLKKKVDVDSPFEPVLDEDGWETDEVKPKDGLIIIPIDVYEHSGTVWFIRGEAPVGCSCQFDSTCGNREAPFYMYCDKKRWDDYCGNCEWKFVDGKPSEELLKKAYEAARGEINEMNLAESGSYYAYRTEKKITETGEMHILDEYEHTGRVESRKHTFWDATDESCGGYLTDHPARDVDFTLGCPVVTTEDYLVGATFEQSCWAYSDDMTGKFIKLDGKGFKLVDDPVHATLWGEVYPKTNRKVYENEFKRALTVVDVTERVWARFPECHAERKEA